MKSALLFALILTIPSFSQTKIAYAVSKGYERYKDDINEVYLEYLPIVPYDPFYPTASEEFAIKFYLHQTSHFDDTVWWYPTGFEIKVYFYDDTCGEPDDGHYYFAHLCESADYVDGGRWYPISTSQYGMNVMWTLSGGYGILELSASVSGCDVYGYSTNYTKYYESYGGKSFLHIQSLSSVYNSYFWWTSAEVSGAGTIGIRNGDAKRHDGHHALIWVHAELWYRPLAVLAPYIKIHSFNFVLGDDVPNTDCWLTVEQGRTRFSNPHPIPLGDMNKDRRVDSTDISIVYSMLGTNPPPYNYRYCDMNVDGKVDYEDIGSEFGYYLGWQTRNYTYAPPIEQTTSAFGQAINELRKYTMNDGQEDGDEHWFSVGYEVTG